MAFKADTDIERITFLLKDFPSVDLTWLISSILAEVCLMFLPSFEMLTRSKGEPYIWAS